MSRLDIRPFLIEENLLEELVGRLDDKYYDNFVEDFYRQSLYKGLKQTAKKYKIFERIAAFENTEDNFIFLRLPSFSVERAVLVNDKEYVKKDPEEVLVNDYSYSLSSEQKFDYYPKTSKDKIVIYYLADVSIDDFDIEEISPIVDSKYREEIIVSAMLYVATTGLIKYAMSPLRSKYEMILSLYGSYKDNKDSNIENRSSLIKMKIRLPV